MADLARQALFSVIPDSQVPAGPLGSQVCRTSCLSSPTSAGLLPPKAWEPGVPRTGPAQVQAWEVTMLASDCLCAIGLPCLLGASVSP